MRRTLLVFAACLAMSPPVSAFSPNSVAGLVDHWNPNDVVGSDGDAVASWTGAVNGLVFSGPGGGDDPALMGGTRQPSGKQAVLFGNTNNRMTVSDATLNNGQVTYMGVVCWYEMNSSNNSQWYFNKDNTNPATVACRIDPAEPNKTIQGAYRLDGSEGTGHKAIASAYTRPSLPIVLTIRYDGAEMIVRANGVQVASNANSGAIDTDNAGALVLGNHPSSFSASAIWVGDLAVWDNAVSDANVTSLENDLMAAWNLGDYHDEWTTGSRTQVATPAAGEDEIFSPSIVDDGAGTIYMFAAVREDSTNSWRWIDYWTSGDSGATWTRNSGSPIVDADTDTPPGCRAVGAVLDGSTWHLLVDGGNGSLYHFTGADLATLTDNGSVYSGEGTGNLQFARHPCIRPDQVSSEWQVYFDGRAGSATSGNGAIGLVTTVDFATFGTATEVVSPLNYWWAVTDVGAPTVKVIDGTLTMLFAGFNQNMPEANNPHWIGAAKSSDGGASWTMLPEGVPVVSGQQTDSHTSVSGPELFDDGTNLWIYYTARSGATDADTDKVQAGAALTSFLTGSAAGLRQRLQPIASGFPAGLHPIESGF